MTDIIARTIADAARVSGLGRTTLYNLIGSGKIEAVKAGGKTLVLDKSLRGYVESLPKAEIRCGQGRAA